ncbi:extracellular solute-binding protein [Cohnella pontilimi]|uniref:extracellular solute-binding protein n=1 Tax=Cohnella pontilimi TaxID=2564100 RepID=UPI001FE49023|nr:extracellular solute-binding protein [Cohnella pontilimi]
MVRDTPDKALPKKRDIGCPSCYHGGEKGSEEGWVNPVARRKSALWFLLLLLTVLLLSPWFSAPSPTSPEVRESRGGPAAAAVPVAEKEPVRIRVAAALNEQEFRFLQKQNDESAYRHPDIVVEFIRIDPEAAYLQFREAFRLGEAADVMLVENEWIKKFAASGYLLPVDGAFMGESLAEQFDALSASVKWNDYLWGVPRDFDPYVVVWNLSVLNTLLGDTAVTPQGTAQWRLLAEKSRESGKATAWLAIQESDAFAWLAWLQTVTGQRSDTIWTDGPDIWNGSPRADAMALLDQERQGVHYAAGDAQAAALVAAGKAAAAVLPYSEALKLTQKNTDKGAGAIVMDRGAWRQPFHWPRGRSFVVSSRTQAEDAARKWIEIMTESGMQQDNVRMFGKLPVYRSMYGPDSIRVSLFSGSSAGTFPNLPPADDEPSLPDRLSSLLRLWSEWAGGRMTLDDWIRRWPETSAELQLND